MIRQMIAIDKERCNGCGLCISACHEGALALIDGKATLVRDDYCDGLGNCLPVCPTDALSFEMREALPFDDTQVEMNSAGAHDESDENLPCGCPGTQAKTLHRTSDEEEDCCSSGAPVAAAVLAAPAPAPLSSQLNQWPVQIKLVPVNAPYFEDAHLLIAADCAAYAYANFHTDFMKNKITLIGCPKLDEGSYTEKLAAILSTHTIKSVTVARMEVPCCGGIEQAVVAALRESGKMIPWQVVTLSTDGRILDN